MTIQNATRRDEERERGSRRSIVSGRKVVNARRFPGGGCAGVRNSNGRQASAIASHKKPPFEAEGQFVRADFIRMRQRNKIKERAREELCSASYDVIEGDAENK
jgi:hypothetical protein